MKHLLLGIASSALLLLAGCKKNDNGNSGGAAVRIGDQITYQAAATGGDQTMIVGYYNEDVNLITVSNAPSAGWTYTFTVKKDPTYVTFGANGGTGSKVTGKILRNGREVKAATSDFSINITYP